MKARICKTCHRPIPRERLQALPDTQTCIDHSDARPRTEADVDIDGADDQDMRRESLNRSEANQ